MVIPNAKINYIKVVPHLESLYRSFLDMIKINLRRMGIVDINNVQCVILYNIGLDKSGDLNSTEIIKRGYYLGSNVSYNIMTLLRNNYIIQKVCVRDRRVQYIHLSEKGQALFNKMDDLFTTDLNTDKHYKHTMLEDVREVRDICDRILGEHREI